MPLNPREVLQDGWMGASMATGKTITNKRDKSLASENVIGLQENLEQLCNSCVLIINNLKSTQCGVLPLISRIKFKFSSSHSSSKMLYILTTVNHWHMYSPHTSASFYILFPMAKMFILQDKAVASYLEAWINSGGKPGSSVPFNSICSQVHDINDPIVLYLFDCLPIFLVKPHIH